MKDLSPLAKDGWPAYGASMAGGNTVTAPPASNDALKPAPGSVSESTADIIMSTIPDMKIPDGKSYKTDIGVEAMDAPPVAHEWKKVT